MRHTRAHRQFFYLVCLGIQTSDLSVTGPTLLTARLPADNLLIDWLIDCAVFCCSCFLSLLLVAAVVWKVKQTCWASRRREVGHRSISSVVLIFGNLGGVPGRLHCSCPAHIYQWSHATSFTVQTGIRLLYLRR